MAYLRSIYPPKCKLDLHLWLWLTTCKPVNHNLFAGLRSISIYISTIKKVIVRVSYTPYKENVNILQYLKCVNKVCEVVKVSIG